MRLRLGLGVGAAVGYVLGAKAGRHRYEQLKGAAARAADNPIAHSATSAIRGQAGKVEHAVMGKLGMEQSPVEPSAVDDARPTSAAAPPEEAGPALDEAATAIGESWAASIEGTDQDIRAGERGSSG